MITQEQFAAAAVRLAECYANFTVERIATWYEDFKHWDQLIFSAVIKMAPKKIDYLTIKALYDLAEEIHCNRYGEVQEYVDYLRQDEPHLDYPQRVHELMQGWMCPDREGALSYLPSNDPIGIWKREKYAELERSVLGTPELTS